MSCIIASSRISIFEHTTTTAISITSLSLLIHLLYLYQIGCPHTCHGNRDGHSFRMADTQLHPPNSLLLRQLAHVSMKLRHTGQLRTQQSSGSIIKDLHGP